MGPRLQALLEVNREHDRPIRPSLVRANRDDWLGPSPVEFYVDFETVSSLDDDFSSIPDRGGQELIFMIDRNGSVSFAGANYRVGNAFRGRQVEVSLAGDTVQIWSDDRIIRTHAARHDRRKEHGAFANPGGRPDRINAA